MTGIETRQAQNARYQPSRNPYQPVGDFLSNVNNFKIIESTLREGEQFANAFFDTVSQATSQANTCSSQRPQAWATLVARRCFCCRCVLAASRRKNRPHRLTHAFFLTSAQAKKIEIAKALDDFGVDYIELTSPAASEQSRLDCAAICKLGLKAKILTHIRCHMDDARIAVETGVDGVDIVIGTSSFLMEHSHGKDMTYITNTAIEVINFVKSKGIEVRFSSEDSFRSNLVDLLSIYSTVDKIGVNRVGIADTVGCASPRQVYDLVKTLRGVVSW